jgi:serine/threonine protein phosphatase PrpC
MSTTVTSAVVRDDQLIVANVGDSRTYLIQNGQARQLTDDHTWVEEQVRVGLISRTEAAKHPQRNIITRSLGSDRTLDIDIFETKLEPGDSILLCSDGLSNLISQQEIGNIVSKGWMAEGAVNELIELAIKRSAPDNVTAVLINIVRSKGDRLR